MELQGKEKLQPRRFGKAVLILGVQKVSKISILGELWSFLKVRKKWWLAPIVIFLILLGGLIVITQGSALAPFIYALF